VFNFYTSSTLDLEITNSIFENIKALERGSIVYFDGFEISFNFEDNSVTCNLEDDMTELIEAAEE
jgi:hypothetical protein